MKLLLALFLGFSPIKVHAEQVSEPISEEVVVEESDDITEEEKEALKEILAKLDEKGYAEEIKKYVSKYVEDDKMSNIISWGIYVISLISLVFIYLKYRKANGNTIEEVFANTKDLLSGKLKECFDKYSGEYIEKLESKIGDLTKANETIMKVLVLMQDESPKGRVALLEYLGSKTNVETIKETVSKVEEVIKVEEKKVEEAKEKVADEYSDIF